MTQDARLAERFEAHRYHLTAVARRILGVPGDADDAVQEAWLRFSRADTSDVASLQSWLTTVVSRVCLSMLQSRRARPEVLPGPDLPEPGAGSSAGPDPADPEQETLLADAIGLAMLVVLDTLTPAERVALVLHDMFGVPFEEIATIIGRSTAASRQLASRGRRRVRGQDGPGEPDRVRQARLVDAFLAASRRGDFSGLLAVLDPGVELTADPAAARLGVAPRLRGADDVAAFARRAGGAVRTLVDGQPGLTWMPGGRPRVVFRFTIGAGRITGIELVAEPDSLRQLDLVVLESGPPAGWRP
ncbi:MAG TPA: sigma-70 family RNA polymerase sigma factor [Streptosporangiaceae bacterium]